MPPEGLHTMAEANTTQIMASSIPIPSFPTFGKAYIRKGFVDTPSGQLHYRSSRPAYGVTERHDVLVFLHKVAASSAAFETLMLHYAAEGFTSLAPDIPGFGGSFDPSDEDLAVIARDGTAWYANLLAGALRSILSGVSFSAMTPRPVHILGHHIGAALGVELAAAPPQAPLSSVYRPPSRGLVIKSLSLLGPSIMTASQRALMKPRFQDPFDTPVPDGSHLIKTWNYLRDMGVLGPPHLSLNPSAKDLELHHRETLDHIRAWKSRVHIYQAIWDLDQEALFQHVACPVLAMCATDDSLWPFFANVQGIQGIQTAIVGGGNFSTDRDSEGIIREWTTFLCQNGAYDIIEPIRISKAAAAI